MRLALLPVLVALGLAAAWAPERAGAATALSARLVSCASGADLSDRAATFRGSMPEIAGTRRMSMRFTLLQRTELESPFAAVAVPTWGRWERSQPGRPGFIYVKRVEGLRGPGAYRALVRFRWYGRGGRLLRATSRLTAVCTQPDRRPDLRAGTLVVAPGPSVDSLTYRLAVRNVGRGDAPSFAVSLAVAGAPADSVRLAGLEAGGRTVAVFVAPRCRAGQTLAFTLDAGQEVDESGVPDDVVERPCPTVAGA